MIADIASLMYSALWTLIYSIWRRRRVFLLACSCGSSGCRRDEPNTTHTFAVYVGCAVTRWYSDRAFGSCHAGPAITVQVGSKGNNRHVHPRDYGVIWVWASDPSADAFRAQHLLIESAS